MHIQCQNIYVILIRKYFVRKRRLVKGENKDDSRSTVSKSAIASFTYIVKKKLTTDERFI